MSTFYTEEEIKHEIDNDISKPVAYSGISYPIEKLSPRQFEILMYFIYKDEIGNGMHSNKYDSVFLMKGTAERGRDSILTFEKRNVGLVQCKLHTAAISKPDFAREIIKFALHAIQDQSLITDIRNFTYNFIALKGLSEPGLELYINFNSQIKDEPELEKWANEVIAENKSLKFKNFLEVKEKLLEILTKIKPNLIIGSDINTKLKNSKTIVAIFFEIEKVADEGILRKVLSEVMNYKNDPDLEKLRQHLADIPKEKRMDFGLFSLYGYDRTFYKKVLNDLELMKELALMKNTINQRFIDYLNETIRKYQLLFVSGHPQISPFTKQVVVPYLFNKFAKQHYEEMTGPFMLSLSKLDQEKLLIYQLQTLDQHKAYLLDVGDQVLRDDYSKFVGTEDLIELKKKISKFVHAGFKSVDEMNSRFDKDMFILMPIIEQIEGYIKEIMPQNPTLIMTSKGLHTKEDYQRIMEEVNKLQKN